MRVRQRVDTTVPWSEVKPGDLFRVVVPGGPVWMKTQDGAGVCRAVSLETGQVWQPGTLIPAVVFPAHGEFVEQ